MLLFVLHLKFLITLYQRCVLIIQQCGSYLVGQKLINVP